jgi:hypothetical protein
MNTRQRMHYILNHREIITHYMKLHDEEVKTRKKPNTLRQLWKMVVGSGK